MSAIIDKKVPKIELRHITGPDMLEKVVKLFLEYAQSLEIDLAFQDFEDELAALPGKYGPPDGVLILASVDGQEAGCAALRRISENICEMKRLYVRECYRGSGFGSQLISMIIQAAQKMNYSYMRLDTLATMEKAQELYRSYGFYEIEPYIYNPIEGTRYMELRLND